MFRWYREAEIRYAYLENMPPLRRDQNTFLRSRWFTRGWTLQKLIAPQRVDFHASD
ncbi:HET domain-containing protein [Colletotrichum filicis]|nr:HET domain-containing protein [Colletotrichum filicis]